MPYLIELCTAIPYYDRRPTSEKPTRNPHSGNTSAIFDFLTLVFIRLVERQSIFFGAPENTFIAVWMSHVSCSKPKLLLLPVYILLLQLLHTTTTTTYCYYYTRKYLFRVYMKTKPGRYGMKVWAMADAQSYYCSNFQVYLGSRRWFLRRVKVHEWCATWRHTSEDRDETLLLTTSSPTWNSPRIFWTTSWHWSVPCAETKGKCHRQCCRTSNDKKSLKSSDLHTTQPWSRTCQSAERRWFSCHPCMPMTMY